MIKVISVAAMIAGLATTSFAGSLNTQTEPEPDNTFVAAPSSAGLAVPLAIGGGLVGLALIANDDDSGSATTTVVAD